MTEKYIALETDRLALKHTNIEDSELLYKLLNSPKWKKYIGDRNIKQVKDAEAYIQKYMLPQIERLGYGNYTISRKKDNLKIGTCGLYDREGIDGVDIGFALLPEHEGNGYAFEACNRLKVLAFDNIGLPNLHAITNKDNLASQKIIKKLGLKYTKAIVLPNTSQEILQYSLKKKDETQ